MRADDQRVLLLLACATVCCRWVCWLIDSDTIILCFRCGLCCAAVVCCAESCIVRTSLSD